MLDVQAKVGIDQQRCDVFTEFMQAEIRNRGHEVIGKTDINASLGLEKMREGLGCDSATCLAEIGGALGVDEVVHGAIAKMGPYLLVTIKRASARDARVITQSARKLLDGGDKELLDAIGVVVDDLYGAVEVPAAHVDGAPEEELSVADDTPQEIESDLRPRRFGAVPIVLFSASAVAFLAAAIYEVSAYRHATRANDDSYVGGQVEADLAVSDQRNARIGAAAATVLGLGGLVVWWLAEPDDASVVLAPATGGGHVRVRVAF